MTDATGPPSATNRLGAILAGGGSSERLRAALDAGSRPRAEYAEALVDRCAVEPDFFVREMLTWALTRHSPDVTLPLLMDQLRSSMPQARSQALHTLAKIGDPRGWAGVTSDLMRDAEVEVARAAWRAAVLLAPVAARGGIAAVLGTQLGRGDPDVWLSLVRAFTVLGDAADAVLTDASVGADTRARMHAIVTRRLIDDPEEGFDAARFEAERIVMLPGPSERPRRADD